MNVKDIKKLIEDLPDDVELTTIRWKPPNYLQREYVRLGLYRSEDDPTKLVAIEE